MKRANDRESQRAIRQRQKDYIASLEERIGELSRKENSDISLEEVKWRNLELEEELRLLRETLNESEESTSSPELTHSPCTYSAAHLV